MLPSTRPNSPSARPAFVGLIYPVISLDTAISHGDSAPNLVGPNAPPELIAGRSPALHVTKEYAAELRRCRDGRRLHPAGEQSALDPGLPQSRAPVEAHFFAEGGHGFGLHLPKEMPGSRWPDLFALWMRKHGG